MTEFARCPAFNIECQYVAEVDRLIAENERLRERLAYQTEELSKYRIKYMVGTSVALGETK